MKKSTILLTLLLFSAAVFPAAGAARSRPNLLFVFADQLRASATGYGGDPNVRTPQLDSLARASLNFRNAVSVCPVCTPYRAALLTGRFPTSTGMFLNDAHLPDREVTIAEVLRDAGYQTGYIGKWHLDGHGRKSFIPPERRQGFDYWRAAECDHDYRKSHYYSGASPEMQTWEGYDAYAQTRDAREYLQTHGRQDKPFALFISYGIPHFPHASALDEFRALFPPEKIRFLANVPPEMQTPENRIEAQGYYAHIAALDQCLGDLWKALRDTGLEQNTILVFTSDHGEMMGSHRIRPTTKQVAWDESAHVPFLLRYPAVQGKSGAVVDTPITTPDIMPTLLSLIGAPVPPAVEGRDLSAAVRRGGSRNADREALFMGVAPWVEKGPGQEYRAIRTARYTYVRRLSGPWLLFDHRQDPLETDNLLEQPSRAPLAAQMERRLQSALRQIRDEFRPAGYYVEKFGFTLAPHGSISYAPGARPQEPAAAAAP